MASFGLGATEMTLNSDNEALLAELLLNYFDARSQGEDVSAETVAGARTDLITELKRRIDAIQWFDGRFVAELELAFRQPGAATSQTHYGEISPHAAGGQGEVYTARNVELRRREALKFLKARYADDAESRNRFRAEAEITGRLEHPGIVPIYGLGKDNDGYPCYAMRFISGVKLQNAIDTLHRSDALDPDRRKKILLDLRGQIASGPSRPEDPNDLRQLIQRELLSRFRMVCQTIAYAHSEGVVHCDIKPDNIMLGRYGETLVVDWGIAKQLADSQALASESRVRSMVTDDCEAGAASSPPDDANEPGPARAGSSDDNDKRSRRHGTPAYMSPEQLDGREIRRQSDVYSLGATLYTILTGRAPFSGVGLLSRIKCGEFPPPRQVQPRVPKPLQAICLKAMAKEAGERYASAGEMADDIANFLADGRVSAYREPIWQRLARWARRHRAATRVAAAALVVVSVTTSWPLWRALSNRLWAQENEEAAEIILKGTHGVFRTYERNPGKILDRLPLPDALLRIVKQSVSQPSSDALVKQGIEDVVDEYKTGVRADSALDLRLMPGLNDPEPIPVRDKNVVIVATVKGVLHFRLFNSDGVKVADTDEDFLAG